MKKWFKLHKKQIFAIICVAMLSLSCVTFVAAEDNTSYNIATVTDVSICGLSQSDLQDAGFVFPSIIYNYNCNAINKYVKNVTGLNLEFDVQFSCSAGDNDTYFFISCYPSIGDSNGVSSITLCDFYVPFTSHDAPVFRLAGSNDDGYFNSDSELIINYSAIGSSEILSNTLYTLSDTGEAEVLFTDAFDGVTDDVYVHSVTLLTPANSLSDIPFFGISVVTDTSYDGRSADIERASSNNGGGILASLFDVFTSVTQWLVNSLVTVVSLFFVNGKFTVIGILSIIATGISIVLLIISIIAAYLRFRG